MIGMARPNLIGIAAVVFLLTVVHASFVNTASCTKDCSTPFTPGAVAFWPMSAETKGADLSGNGNQATLVGLTYTNGPSGVSNGSLHFHGNNESYAWVNMSPSLEVGKYSGFSVCGFVRFLVDMEGITIIDAWNELLYGWGVLSFMPNQNLLMLFHTIDSHKYYGHFSNLNFTTGSWRFFGVSYDKATGRVTGFMNGQREDVYTNKNIFAYTTLTTKVALGRSYLPGIRKVFKGDMSCMMLFQIALTAEDFERIWKFCRTMNSTQISIPNINMTDITPTSARASWSKSPGTFSGYSITIEGKQSFSNNEAVHPRYLSSSVALPKVSLVNLVPGATYRIHVWHTQGSIRGARARTSHWFETSLPPVVKPESINFSAITATSTKVNWGAVNGNNDGYVVHLTPTAGGATADPSTVPRGAFTTSLTNLKPGSYYTITIRTTVGTSLSSPSTTTFQTKELAPVEMESINLSMITATSAKATWKEVSGNIDGYVVYLTPTAGGAKADPSTVPRGTFTTSLRNLTPRSYYTITIRTKTGNSLSSSSTTTFQTKDLPKPEATTAVAGLAVAVVCLFVIVVFVVVTCILIRRNSSLPAGEGDDRQGSISNRGFQPDEPSQSLTGNNGENYNPYEVPNRLKIEGNTQSPVYENVNMHATTNNDYETLNVINT